jgi:hypothetical protein
MRSDIKNKLEEIEQSLGIKPDPTLTIEERIILVLHNFIVNPQSNG